MPDNDRIPQERARQGTTLHRMRYVLGISLALAVIVMVILLADFV